MKMRDEVFEAVYGKNVLRILKEEATHRTNIAKPLGVNAWAENYSKVLEELKLDYALTHVGELE